MTCNYFRYFERNVCNLTVWKSARDRFLLALATNFIASISAPVYFNANFPLTMLCTSSGLKNSMLFSIYVHNNLPRKLWYKMIRYYLVKLSWKSIKLNNGIIIWNQKLKLCKWHLRSQHDFGHEHVFESSESKLVFHGVVLFKSFVEVGKSSLEITFLRSMQDTGLEKNKNHFN